MSRDVVACLDHQGGGGDARMEDETGKDIRSCCTAHAQGAASEVLTVEQRGFQLQILMFLFIVSTHKLDILEELKKQCKNKIGV